MHFLPMRRTICDGVVAVPAPGKAYHVLLHDRGSLCAASEPAENENSWSWSSRGDEHPKNSRHEFRSHFTSCVAVMLSGLLTACVWLAAAADGLADDPCASRPQDEVWLVSARNVSCVDPNDTLHLPTQRYVPGAGWETGELHQLFQPTTPDQITVIFVHGNRVSSGEAASEGRFVYRLLTSQVDDPVSIRFVVWSWPSAQVRGQLRDVRVKAQRTDLGGHSLGWFLQQLSPEQRVSLLGYSFGARIATGGLHVASGGQLAGRVLAPRDEAAPQARVVLLAAALHNNWLQPGCYHGDALTHVDYLLNLYDCCDPVLKRYPLLYKHSHAQALGFTGMNMSGLGEMADRIEQRDVCSIVQRSHEAIHYFESARLRQRMQQVLFWHAIEREPTGEPCCPSVAAR